MWPFSQRIVDGSPGYGLFKGLRWEQERVIMITDSTGRFANHPSNPVSQAPALPPQTASPRQHKQTVGIYFPGLNIFFLQLLDAASLILPTGQAPRGRSVEQLDKAEEEVKYGVISGEVRQRAVFAGSAGSGEWE